MAPAALTGTSSGALRTTLEGTASGPHRAPARRASEKNRRLQISAAGSRRQGVLTNCGVHQLGRAKRLTYVALIPDVIVAPEFHGCGIGATIMESVVTHPRLAGVRSLELVCQPDVVGFYGRWGSTDSRETPARSRPPGIC